MTSQDDTKRFYDVTAQEMADKWYPDERLMPLIREFMSYLPDSPHVLDMGCGPGHESLRMTSVGARVVGVDFSVECIKIARSRCPQARFELADFRELDPGLGPFDGVFASASLIHISPAELPGVMRRASAALVDGGLLLAIVQNLADGQESQFVVERDGLRRIIYRQRPEDLASASDAFAPPTRLALVDELHEKGWRAWLLKKL